MYGELASGPGRYYSTCDVPVGTLHRGRSCGGGVLPRNGELVMGKLGCLHAVGCIVRRNGDLIGYRVLWWRDGRSCWVRYTVLP
jgi:hypothetical protein